MFAREESHSVSGLLLPRRDKGVTAEPAGLKEAAFGPSRQLANLLWRPPNASLSLPEHQALIQ